MSNQTSADLVTNAVRKWITIKRMEAKPVRDAIKIDKAWKELGPMVNRMTQREYSDYCKRIQ